MYRFLSISPLAAASPLLSWFLLAASLAAQPYDQAPSTLRVMTWNVEWMFDDYLGDNRSSLAGEQSAPSAEFWQAKLKAVAEVLSSSRPDIVALQEIEGRQTLVDIADVLKSEHQLSYRYAFIEGSDWSTEQDVGLLVRNGLTSYRRHEQSQSMFDSQKFYNLSKHLVAELRWEDIESPLTIMNVHLRARPESEKVRVRQARLARYWLTPQIEAGQDVILLGDFNCEHPAIDLGDQAEPQAEVAEILGGNGHPPLIDLLAHLPDSGQSTHIILEKQFDRLFVSQSLMHDGPGQDWTFESVQVLNHAVVRGEPDGFAHWSKRHSMPLSELDVSDHHPVLATFRRK